MASLNSNSISGITTEIFNNSHAVNKKYIDDNVPTLPDPIVGGGKFLVTTDGVDITWADISNVEEFNQVGISTYYIPETASAIHIEAVGGGQAGNNSGSILATDDQSRLAFTCCTPGTCMCEVRDVAYGNGKYLLVGACSVITSTDSINWEPNSIGCGRNFSNSFSGADYHDGLFLIASSTSCGTLYASTDTTHWTLRTINIASSGQYACAGWGGLKYLNNSWYLLDGIQCSLQASTDSIHWTLRTIPHYSDCGGGHRLSSSDSHYAYRSTCCGGVVSSTDSVAWFVRTLPYANCGRLSCGHAFLFSPSSNLWVSAYRTYNNQQCPTGSELYYGGHVATSTDTIHWTLRTLAYAQDRPEGYSSSASEYFTEIADVGGRLYMSVNCLIDPHNFPTSQNSSSCTYFPLTSTDAIHWEAFTTAVGCCSPLTNASSQPYSHCTMWNQYFSMNNKLLTTSVQCAAVISRRLGVAGNGGNAAEYALFSIDPSRVKDKKLEINIGSGGVPSAGSCSIGCDGGSTTISYLSQEGSTSYYFNGAGISESVQLLTTASDQLILGTGDFTVEFFVNFSSADANLDTIIDTRTSTGASNGFLIGRYHTTGHENKIELFTASDYRVTADVTVDNNVWTHVAVVRSSSVTKMYVNGIAYSNTYNDSNNYSNNYLKLGLDTSSSNQFDGYLSGIRIDKGIARYTSNFRPPSPDVQQGNKTVFLSGVKSSIEDQTGNTTLMNNLDNVTLCTSTCLPDMKVSHTINGGYNSPTLSCTISPMRNSLGGLGQDDPNSYTVQDFYNPFQASGGGAGANLNETGGSSGALLNYSTEVKATGGANPQSGVSLQSAIYGTGGGGGNPGVDGANGFLGGGGGGGGAPQSSGGAATYPAWTLRTTGHQDSSGNLAPIFGVGYGYGQWLAAGQYNAYSTSTDTIHWTRRTTGYGGGNFNFNFAYDGNNTLALGSENGKVATSTDAIHFTARTMAVPKSASNTYGLEYVNNLFLSGHQNSYLQASTDAIHWTLRTSGGEASKDIYSFTYGAGKYVYGNQGGQIATSTDTIHWAQRTIGATTTNILGLTYGDSLFVAAGYGARISTSTDAIHWTTRTAGVPSGVGLGAAIHSNGLYHITERNGCRIISSTDSISWTLRTNNDGDASYYGESIETNGSSEYIVGGGFGVVSYADLSVAPPSTSGGKGGDGFARITWW